MLNKYPLWKYLLIAAVLVIGFIYSAPNLYPDDPAVQISGASTALQVSQADLDRASKALTDAGIEVKAATLAAQGKGGLIRLLKKEQQLPAKDVVRKTMGDDYVVALNLAQTTPNWLRSLGASPMKLGLDLSGGVHFLLEVDMEKALDARRKVYEGDVKSLLRKERVKYRSLPDQDGAIQLGFSDEDSLSKAQALIRKDFTDFQVTAVERNGMQVLRLAMTPAKLAEIREYSIKQNLTTVRNRVNELGVAEPCRTLLKPSVFSVRPPTWNSVWPQARMPPRLLPNRSNSASRAVAPCRWSAV
jgi:preprotein translocase subunit SecD